jgi:hypothetical protein
MNNTELSLDVGKSYNLKTMTLFDTSKYCEDEAIENYLVEVLPVNKSTWVTFYVQKGFVLTLNSSNLGYKKVNNTTDLIDLPDGVYEIKQSYKPNIHTVSHYYTLRTAALQLKYVELLCAHFGKKCDKSDEVYLQETKALTQIKQYIDAAEYVVGEKHEKECGIEYYNQAIELIKQFENECGC